MFCGKEIYETIFAYLENTDIYLIVCFQIWSAVLTFLKLFLSFTAFTSKVGL